MKFIYIYRGAFPSKNASSVNVSNTLKCLDRRGCLHQIFSYAGVVATESFNNHKIVRWKTTLSNQMNMIWFLLFLGCNLIFSRREGHIVYTRDLPCLTVAWFLGFKVILELHTLPKYQSRTVFHFAKALNILKSNRIRIIAISYGLANALKRELGVTSGIDVLHDGVPEYFLKKSYIKNHRDLSKFKIGYVGSFHKGKGVEHIIKLATCMPNCEFSVYGNIEHLATAINKLPENFSVFDYVPHHKVFEIMNSFDLLLMPYGKKVFGNGIEDISGFMSPIKLFEYMSSGTPILCSDLKIIREVVDEQCVYFAQPDSVPEWIAQIKKIQLNQDEAEMKALCARQLVSKYTWESRVNKIIKITESF